MSKKTLALFFTLLSVLLVKADQATQRTPVSEDTVLQSGVQLSFSEYLSVVKAYHPMARQAGLKPLNAAAGVLKARGAFDPRLESDLSEKQFDDKQYYSVFSAGLKIPVWYGLEFRGGYERNSGAYLNPENQLPGNGLYYAGLTLNLGSGLFIDERRSALRQAQIFRSASEAEQSKMLNSLLYEAGTAYWDWYAAHRKRTVFLDAIRTAELRFEAVKQLAGLGDRPYIDTVEAGIQLQERRLGLRQAELEFRNASLRLSLYLWLEDNTPYTLPETALPSAPDMPVNTLLPPISDKSGIDSLLQQHPALRMKSYALDALSIENEWKREQLKPRVQVSYNPLFVPENNVPGPYNAGNYKLGLGFSMPVFLRKERGELRMNGFKIKEAELDLSYSSLDLYRQSEVSLNELENTQSQYNLYSRTVGDYGTLYEAEKRIFEGGESSLFMINAREMSYIMASLKLIEILYKNRKAELSAAYALGLLGR